MSSPVPRALTARTPLCLLLTLVTAVHGCGAALSPVSQGHTGFLSDRAFEVDATLTGSTLAAGPTPAPDWRDFAARFPSEASRLAFADVRRRVDHLASSGAPLWLPQAHLQLDAAFDPGTPTVRYEAHVQNVIRRSDAPLGPDAYRDAEGLRFRWPTASQLAFAPPYEALADDGVIRVGAAFGQMLPDGEEGEENGRWSRDAFVAALVDRGYQLADDPLRPGALVWKRSIDDLRVEVEVHGPDEVRLGERGEADAAGLRAMIGRSEVVYVNGHTRQAAFGPLTEAASYAPPRTRVVMLDLCWSQQEYTRAVLDAGGAVQVVATEGRVVTGSVGSASWLLDALVDGAAGRGPRTPWLPLLTGMNDLADARSAERAGKVDARMDPPEVYGVSPAW